MALTLTPGSLIVASAYPDPPFDLIDNGSASGFDIELMRAICAQLGRINEGRASVDRLLAINSQATVATFKAICNAPFRRNPRALKKYLDGLRRCGLPEGVAPH